ncbi:hypothetical protein GQR58_018912 [Nymphon striatum]|nr:hypothetical protein GQR58_018912 [Nymphon striatum]
MNISTGQILAATTLVDAKRLGLKAMDAATTTNADKIVQPKMETFDTHLKKIQKKIDTVKEVIKEESAVTRALCFAQNLSDEAQTEAFSYEWLEYPSSLFEPEKNGYSMRKGCKSTYLSILQAEVADSWEPPSAHDQVITEARSFFCDLYGKPGYLSLDKLRAHLFASRKLDLRSLPPTEDAFHFHVLRSLCQISLYKQASLSNPVLLPPEEYGRIVYGDRLIPVMKSKPSKPSAAKLKYCKCKKKPNCLRNCPCAKAAVPCIIACAFNGDREKCRRLLTDHYDDDDDDDDNE